MLVLVSLLKYFSSNEFSLLSHSERVEMMEAARKFTKRKTDDSYKIELKRYWCSKTASKTIYNIVMCSTDYI
jgi:hypothetical protein